MVEYDARGQRSIMDPAAMRAIAGGGAVLADAQRHGLDLHLLHDAWRTGGCLQTVAAVRAQFQRVAVGAAAEHLRGEVLPQVAWMTRLAAAAPRGGRVGRGRLGRLDQIRGRRLGGGRRIFAGAGKLFLQLGNRGLQRLKLDTQQREFHSQAWALRTGSRGGAFHSEGILRTERRNSTTHVNAYWKSSSLS